MTVVHDGSEQPIGSAVTDEQIAEEFLRRFVFSDEPETWEMDSAHDMLSQFVENLQVFAERNRKHRDLWRNAGWMMHLALCMHKMDRTEHEFWARPDAERGPDALEDVDDLINYLTFFKISFKKGDIRGRR